MVKILISFIFSLMLSGCANTTPSISIKDTTKQEITNIQKEIETLQCDNISKQTLTLRLETIKADVENISLSCETEKKVYKEEISKLKIIIAILISIIIIAIYKKMGKII